MLVAHLGGIEDRRDVIDRGVESTVADIFVVYDFLDVFANIERVILVGIDFRLQARDLVHETLGHELVSLALLVFHIVVDVVIEGLYFLEDHLRVGQLLLALVDQGHVEFLDFLVDQLVDVFADDVFDDGFDGHLVVIDGADQF